MELAWAYAESGDSTSIQAEATVEEKNTWKQ